MNEGSESHPAPARGVWWAAVISLTVLTAITAVISYEHAYEVFRAAHNTGVLAVLGPVVPDLVIAVCSMALLAAARTGGGTGTGQPVTAIFALVAFIGVTVALNAVAGLRYGRGSALLAVLAPVGYLAGLHILTGMMRRGRAAAFPSTTDGGGPVTHGGEEPPAEAAQPPDTLTALQVLLDTDSQRKLAALLRVDRNLVQSWAAMAREVAEDPPVVEAGEGARVTPVPGAVAPAVTGPPPVAPAGATMNGQHPGGR